MIIRNKYHILENGSIDTVVRARRKRNWRVNDECILISDSYTAVDHVKINKCSESNVANILYIASCSIAISNQINITIYTCRSNIPNHHTNFCFTIDIQFFAICKNGFWSPIIILHLFKNITQCRVQINNSASHKK
jgi:hypothetical protein